MFHAIRAIMKLRCVCLFSVVDAVLSRICLVSAGDLLCFRYSRGYNNKMVRVKKRYIVLRLHSEKGENQVVSAASVYDEIKKTYHKLYGDFGIAQLGSFGVKYFDQSTKIIFIQCHREVHRQLLHATTLVKMVESKPTSFQTLYIAGTMKSCQKFLLKHSKEELFDYLMKSKESSNISLQTNTS